MLPLVFFIDIPQFDALLTTLAVAGWLGPKYCNPSSPHGWWLPCRVARALSNDQRCQTLPPIALNSPAFLLTRILRVLMEWYAVSVRLRHDQHLTHTNALSCI